MKNRIALKAAREAGHLVFINTARSMGNMPEKVKKLKVDGFICSLGCNIIINGKTARLTTIESDELAELQKKYEKFRSNPYGREIYDYLKGKYAFDPACLTG